MIGFDVGRTSNPAHRLASATGIINQGGFCARLVLVVAIGLVLDWRTPGGGTDYTPSAFRWAMSVQYVLWAVGLGPDLALPAAHPGQDPRGARVSATARPELRHQARDDHGDVQHAGDLLEDHSRPGVRVATGEDVGEPTLVSVVNDRNSSSKNRSEPALQRLDRPGAMIDTAR